MEDGVYTQEKFKELRSEDHHAALSAREKMGNPDNFIIVHPDNDEIICDACNREIGPEDGLVIVRNSYALCTVCQQSALID